MPDRRDIASWKNIKFKEALPTAASVVCTLKTTEEKMAAAISKLDKTANSHDNSERAEKVLQSMNN